MKVKNLISVTAVAAALIAGTAMPSSAAPAAREDNVGKRVGKAIAESWKNHPGDYEAAERASLAAGGDRLSVTFPGTYEKRFTAQEAQKIVKGDLAATVPYVVPTDAFEVSSVWTGAAGGIGYEKYTIYIGAWNFRDDFVNGSAPDDVSAVGIDFPSCFYLDSDGVELADYQNVDHSDLAWLSSQTANQSVWGVRDSTTGFKNLADHGTHTVNLKNPDGTCDPYKVKASYTYEHNQDGAGGWSASVNLGIFSISYSGGNPSALRKGTPYGAFNIQ